MEPDVQSEIEPRPKRKRSLATDDLLESGQDEKWLVSYADMITLLLGFFVVLFSMAMQNRADFEESIRKMSISQDESKKDPEQDQALTRHQKELEIMTQIEDLKNKNQELEQMKLSFDDLKKLLEEKNTRVAQLEAELAKLSQVEIQYKELLSEINDLREQNAKLSKAFMEFQKIVKNSGETLRSIAEQATQDLDIAVGDPIELKKKLDAALKTQKELQEELFELKGPNGASQRFIFAVFKWETDRQDLDLTVTDAAGRVFDMNNRKYQGESGELILTSQSGPGAEIWEAFDPPEGVYTFRIRVRETNGNARPPMLSGIIQSNRSNIKINGSTIQPQVGSTVEFKVSIDGKGFIRLLM